MPITDQADDKNKTEYNEIASIHVNTDNDGITKNGDEKKSPKKWNMSKRINTSTHHTGKMT